MLTDFYCVLQEQRTHIDVLDAALSNAQNTVLRLEEEVRQKEAYADRVKQMTKSLEQLQVRKIFLAVQRSVMDQCCGSGSVLDLYSGASWIRIHTCKCRIKRRQKMSDFRY